MRRKIIVIFSLLIIIICLQSVGAFQISECNPDPCPTGYTQGPKFCANGVCSIQCDYYTACDDNNVTVYSVSGHLPSYNISSGGIGYYILFGDFIPNATNKCYRFSQTTPTNFVNDSSISSTNQNSYDSGIAFYWKNPWYNITSYSTWYDQQNYFSTWSWDSGDLDDTSVWVDSCNDEGDNFNSADNFQFKNDLYCAPNQAACQDFNSTYCDTDCYGWSTSLWLSFNPGLPNGLSCNNYGSYDQVLEITGPSIDFITFNPQTVYMIVDEFNATLDHSFNNTCNYNPQCNPADPCCDQSGNFRPNGYVCNSAHNPQCSDATICQGTAVEDRCTGTSASCPDSNNVIDYDAACDDLVCVGQSCSNSTLQPSRSCSVGLCQVNDPYDCPNNLNCLDGTSCKKSASSGSDCKTGYTFDVTSSICWLNESNGYNLIYDANGNLISGFGFNYSYDTFNKLANVTVSTTGELVAKYVYDQSGERVKKVEFADGTNVTTYYVGDNFVQTVNSTGTYNETYYYSSGALVARKNNDGQLYFLYPDHLGSTVLITDNNGAVIAQQDYDPFGELSGTSNDRHGYTGHELDSETNNIYMKARFYDPTIGKFIQPDNVIFDAYNPQDLNRYAYVRNNPYTYIDPNGLWAVTVDVGGGVGAGPASGSVGYHIGFSYSNDYGLQVGAYGSESYGSSYLIGSEVYGGASVTPNAKKFSDLFGKSVTKGGSFAYGHGISVDKSVSYDDPNIKSYSLAYSPGIAIEGHKFETDSSGSYKDLGQPKEKNKMDPKKSSPEQNSQKETKTQQGSGSSQPSLISKIGEAVKQAVKSVIETAKSLLKSLAGGKK